MGINLFLEVFMGNTHYKLLVVFGANDIWTRKSLLRRLKDENLIDDALSLGYIEQCGTTDIGEPQYRITNLGIQIRNN